MKTTKLNTTDPNQLLYQNQLLQITVLGGIRLEGLDRLRVTLKIQIKTNNPEIADKNGTASGIAIRHNLDLYNDTQVEKLIRKTAIKLEIGNSVIEASINELIELLEEYRIEQLKDKNEEIKVKELSEEEKAEALKLLTTKNLLLATNELIEQSGIIGEETNRLIMYLIFTSRKRNQPLHIISLGSSGTGKTHLQEYHNYLLNRTNERQGGALSSNYINHHLWTLEKFFEFLHHKGVKNLPNINLKRLEVHTLKRQILTQSEILQLYKTIEEKEAKTTKQQAINYQDLILLTIYYACGLRRTEGVNLTLSDINLDTRILHVKKGKNNKQRLIPFSKTSKEYLTNWIYEHRNILIKDKTENHLFINNRGKPLTGGTLNNRLQRLVDELYNQDEKEMRSIREHHKEKQSDPTTSNSEQKNISLHSLRHSIATHLLANGMDIQKVQRFLGHSSLDSTEIYTHLIEDESRKYQESSTKKKLTT